MNSHDAPELKYVMAAAATLVRLPIAETVTKTEMIHATVAYRAANALSMRMVLPRSEFTMVMVNAGDTRTPILRRHATDPRLDEIPPQRMVQCRM